MSLINCPECGREISTSAKVCPGCGRRKPFNWKPLRWIVGVVVALIALDGWITISIMDRDEHQVQECWDSINSVDAEAGRSKSEYECERLESNFIQRYDRKPKNIYKPAK